MSENDFKQLNNCTAMLAAIHWDLFCKYMIASDGDAGTSISLANTALHEILHMNESSNNNNDHYIQGAKKFAEWLQRNDAFIANSEFDSYNPKLFFSSVESALAEWQREVSQ